MRRLIAGLAAGLFGFPRHTANATLAKVLSISIFLVAVDCVAAPIPTGLTRDVLGENWKQTWQYHMFGPDYYFLDPTASHTYTLALSDGTSQSFGANVYPTENDNDTPISQITSLTLSPLSGATGSLSFMGLPSSGAVAYVSGAQKKYTGPVTLWDTSWSALLDPEHLRFVSGGPAFDFDKDYRPGYGTTTVELLFLTQNADETYDFFVSASGHNELVANAVNLGGYLYGSHFHGTVNVGFLPDATPSIGDEYSIISGSLITFHDDTFELNVNGLSPSLAYDANWGENGLTVKILQGSAVIPEPSTLIIWSLLGAISGGVAWYRKRRRG